MNITLPSKNLRTKDFLIKDGILYLRYGQSFTNVIYSLTYFMKGKRFCYYCKKKIPKKQITMDHMYPRHTGGPTIPQNLLPCCKKCNSKKSDLTYEQYQAFLLLSDPLQKKEYCSKMITFKEGLKAIGLFEIPITWITPVKLDDIRTQKDSANISETKYEAVKLYYETYHQFQRPIILDRNLFVLDGFHSLFLAKSYGLTFIPAIILENVEIRQKS